MKHVYIYLVFYIYKKNDEWPIIQKAISLLSFSINFSLLILHHKRVLLYFIFIFFSHFSFSPTWLSLFFFFSYSLPRVVSRSPLFPFFLELFSFSFLPSRIDQKLFIQASNYEVWREIVNGPTIPKKKVGDEEIVKKESEWDANDLKIAQLNAKVMHTLFFALGAIEFLFVRRIKKCGINFKSLMKEQTGLRKPK